MDTFGVSQSALADVYDTVPIADGESHVTFFRNRTTHELTADIVDSNNYNNAATRVVAGNSTFLGATQTATGFAVLSINEQSVIVYTGFIIANESNTTFSLGSFNSCKGPNLSLNSSHSFVASCDESVRWTIAKWGG